MVKPFYNFVIQIRERVLIKLEHIYRAAFNSTETLIITIETYVVFILRMLEMSNRTGVLQ